MAVQYVNSNRVIITGLKYMFSTRYINEGRVANDPLGLDQTSGERTAAATHVELTTLICTHRRGDIRAS